jgi:micrococcal nuclease
VAFAPFLPIRRAAVVAVVALTALISGGACDQTRGSGARSATAPAFAAGETVVTKEVDGDTIRVRAGSGEERVRFIGVDTPETHGPGGLRECFGQEAARRTAALIPPGTRVRLVRDAEPRDKYGRMLAYVYRSSDGLFVNLALARDGFAAALTIPPNVAHASEFVAAAGTARQGDIGLWHGCAAPG